MTDLELMQQALDALENGAVRWKSDRLHDIDVAIYALRARLAQPEPEPVMAEFKFQEYGPDNWGDSQVTNPEFVAEQKATNEALRNMVQQEPVAWAYRDSSSGNLFGFTSEYYDDEPAKNLVPLYTAPPQRELESEPVAWMNEAGDIVTSDESYTIGWRPLYTAPPQREWQGLTDEEMNACLVEADPCEALLDHESRELMRTVEAKLREKNGNL